jgi:SAM-dependent methyltransferase
MHIHSSLFFQHVKDNFPDYFLNKKILNVGFAYPSKYLFTNCELTNLKPYNSKQLLNECSYDTIISSGWFEHDPHYATSMLNIYKLLKPGGLFLFTCAGLGRNEHGTFRTIERYVYGTNNTNDYLSHYYKNLELNDIANVIDLKQAFAFYKAYYNVNPYDFYFFGIKNGNGLLANYDKYTSYNFKHVREYDNHSNKLVT